jgi:mannan endo-1,4-beta-mannosidase
MKPLFSILVSSFFLVLVGCTHTNQPDIQPVQDLTTQSARVASATTACPAVNTTGNILLGIYYGNQGWAMSDVVALESWQCKKNAVINMFTSWCNRTKVMDDLFNLQLVNIWNNKNVPMITWEPNLCSGTPTDIELRIASGEYDAYITSWATRMKKYLSGPDGIYNTSDDRRAYLRLAHEMNGDWYAWGAAVGNNSPEQYKSMWIRVKGIFTSNGIDSNHLQWVWCVNHTDNGSFTAEQYFPGNSYVDWVAIDGYNWGTSQSWSTWQSPAQTYDNMLNRLKALSTKPIALTEFATTSVNLGVFGKSQWITSAFQYAENNSIRMVTWFNEDKETDWAIFGGTGGDETIKRKKAYSAYRVAISSATYTTSDPTNSRLLTDSQFAGQ